MGDPQREPWNPCPATARIHSSYSINLTVNNPTLDVTQHCMMMKNQNGDFRVAPLIEHVCVRGAGLVLRKAKMETQLQASSGHPQRVQESQKQGEVVGKGILYPQRLLWRHNQ